MANYSRDSFELNKLKHYVGVRMQQGVPLLDADWNEMEDIRREELRSFLRFFVGSGVPQGNNGFKVMPAAGGGVGTIVLTSLNTETAASSIKINTDTSTAAAALGFTPEHCSVEKWGSSPARLTGWSTGPFVLENDMKLVVAADGFNEEEVVFNTGDFADISAATAAEVIGVINGAVTHLSASIGEGNDFIVSGGEGTPDGVGRCVVDGWEAMIENSIDYTAQPLYDNQALADLWGVTPLPALAPPDSGQREDIVYLDVWEREVDSGEDNDLVNPAIGVETCVRLKREWTVRAAEGAATHPEPTPGHVFYDIAKITRTAITIEDIEDLRQESVNFQDLKNYVNSDAPVTSVKINVADGTTGQNTSQGDGIKTGHIQDGAVTEQKLDAAVQDKLAAGGATHDHGQVIQDYIDNLDQGITTFNIQDGAVTQQKLETNVVNKLVTNGNNHTHSGSDGAKIKYSNLDQDGSTISREDSMTSTGWQSTTHEVQLNACNNALAFNGRFMQINASSENSEIQDCDNAQINASAKVRAYSGDKVQINASYNVLVHGASFCQINASVGVAPAKSYSVIGGTAYDPEASPSTTNIKWELDSQTGRIFGQAGLTTGSYTSDYGEYFENVITGEIGMGVLITLEGDKVRPAEADEDVIGVVSGTAAIRLGDSPFHWQGRYLRDEWGRPIYEEIKDPYWQPKTKLDMSWSPGEGETEADRPQIAVETEEDRPIIKVQKENPDYDPTKESKPRSERPDEWTLVGLLGQVYVRCDDTVKPGDFVKSSSQGIGTRSENETKLRAMKVTKAFDGNYSIVYCFLK